MPYCTQSDVEESAGGAARLRQLADWDSNGAVDALANPIAKAEAWINSYVERQRAVPLDPVPEIIRWTCADEVVYRLKKARGPISDDEHRAHEERERWLEGIAEGKISLGVTPAPSASPSNGAEYGERDCADDLLRRSDLGGFS